MELHCLPTETPTASSRGSADLLYDNCPPCPLRKGGGRPAPAGALPASPGRPRAGPAPAPAAAAAHVPTLPPGAGAGAAASGAWPDHSYCSWVSWGRGRGRGAEEGGWRNGRPVGAGPGAGGGGGGGGGDGGGGGREEREVGGEGEEMDGPSPARSLEHESVLSVYDNLREGATPDDLATPTETRILFPYSDDDGDDGDDNGDDDGGFLFPYSEEEIRLLTTELGAASRDSSLWSSCEIILADSRLSDGPPGTEPPGGPEERASDALTADPPPLDLDLDRDRDRRDRRDQPPPDGADPGPDEAPPAGARVPPPLPLADPVASALRSVLTGLQHQMGRQRDEYEARISSLEQRNEELQSQLRGLRANLSQQRRWYQAVQAKIQESERARAAAEARNATIQREMDQFFDTFGELNNEARKAERIVRSF